MKPQHKNHNKMQDTWTLPGGTVELIKILKFSAELAYEEKISFADLQKMIKMCNTFIENAEFNKLSNALSLSRVSSENSTVEASPPPKRRKTSSEVINLHLSASPNGSSKNVSFADPPVQLSPQNNLFLSPRRVLFRELSRESSSSKEAEQFNEEVNTKSSSTPNRKILKDYSRKSTPKPDNISVAKPRGRPKKTEATKPSETPLKEPRRSTRDRRQTPFPKLEILLRNDRSCERKRQVRIKQLSQSQTAIKKNTKPLKENHSIPQPTRPKTRALYTPDEWFFHKSI